MDTRPRTSLISFCTVQLRTLCAAHSLATLCLFMTSGPDPGELPGFWGSMVFRHAPIPRKGSGKQQQQQQIGTYGSAVLACPLDGCLCPLILGHSKFFVLFGALRNNDQDIKNSGFFLLDLSILCTVVAQSTVITQ